MATTTTGMLRIVPALCAFGLLALPACATKANCGSADELAALRKRVQQLEAKDGPIPTKEQRTALLKQTEATLQARVDAEKKSKDDAVSAEVRGSLEKALKPAEKDKDKKVLGDLSEVTCYVTICQGTSTHPSEKAFDAFIKSAFSVDEQTGIPKYAGWLAVTNVEANGEARTAHFFLGKPNKDALPPRPKSPH